MKFMHAILRPERIAAAGGSRLGCLKQYYKVREYLIQIGGLAPDDKMSELT